MPNGGMEEVSSPWVIPCGNGGTGSQAVATWVGLGAVYGGGPFIRAGVMQAIVDVTPSDAIY